MDQILALWDKYSYVYISGVQGTLVLSLVTVFFSSILGTVIALLKMSKIRIFDIFSSLYVGVLRGTPILLQLYFFFFMLPKIVPFELSDTQSIVAALVVNSSSYVAEIIRAGIQAVDKGQIEASKSLGLTNVNIYRKIIFPQAIRNILPALGNEYIAMVKQTSLASVFFVNELTTAYKTVQSATFLAIPSLIIAGILYLIITAFLNKAIEIMEVRLQVYE